MSRFQSRILNILAAGAALAAALLAFAPAARAADFRSGADVVFGASYSSGRSGNHFELSLEALRYHYDFNRRWGIEAQYSHQDNFTYYSGDGDFIDVSARLTLYENDRVKLVGLWGGGILTYDDIYIGPADERIEENDTVATAHIAIAADIALGDRFYLRPEFRRRWSSDIYAPHDGDSEEHTIAFGVRF